MYEGNPGEVDFDRVSATVRVSIGFELSEVDCNKSDRLPFCVLRSAVQQSLTSKFAND